MKEELLKGLTEEQIAKIKECKNQEEVLNLAKEEGIKLTDEQLEAVSGGCGTEHGSTWTYGWACPKCGSRNTKVFNGTFYHGSTIICFDCGYDTLKA